MMRILTFSTLFPNHLRPGHGIFVGTRLKKLVASGEVSARVVAPVPWFPAKAAGLGAYAQYAGILPQEDYEGLKVDHPRYPLIPKTGMSLAPYGLYRGVLPHVKNMIRAGEDFDLIDAHYFYPDGVAAVLLARALKKPVVVTARGTDINLFPDFAIPRRWLRWAIRESDGIITVSAALKDKILTLGGDVEKIRVLRNGVDQKIFCLKDKEKKRHALRMQGLCLLSVGNLVREKGHDLTISALTQLPDVRLYLAGSGPEEEALRQQAVRLGVAERVHFLGRQDQEQLVAYYNAADILVLASAREGMANVLLESLACGTPIVASDIPGMTEVIGDPVAGRLMASRDPVFLAQAVRDLYADLPDREAVRHYGEKFDWATTTRGQIDLFRDIIKQQGQK